MKKTSIILACGLAVVLLACVLCKQYLIGDKPFQALTREELAAVEVKLLWDVVAFKRDDSYRDYCGQAVMYTILKTDGTQTTVMAYNPFIVLDGAGYRCKYDPCEALNQFANNLIR